MCDTYTLCAEQLKDASLWVDKAIIAGELVEANSGKRFDVEGRFGEPAVHMQHLF